MDKKKLVKCTRYADNTIMLLMMLGFIQLDILGILYCREKGAYIQTVFRMSSLTTVFLSSSSILSLLLCLGLICMFVHKVVFCKFHLGIHSALEESTRIFRSEFSFIPIHAEIDDRSKKRKQQLIELFCVLIQKFVASHLSSNEDAHILLLDIKKVIENDTIDIDLVPVSNRNLSREDIYHLGYHVKYYLCKDNNFGANFIYRVFHQEFQNHAGKESVRCSSICRKLAVQEGTKYYVELPVSANRKGVRRKATAQADDIERDLIYYSNN